MLRLAGPGSMQSNESWVGGDATAAAAATGGSAAGGGCGCGGLGLNIAPCFWNFDCTDEREECGGMICVLLLTFSLSGATVRFE